MAAAPVSEIADIEQALVTHWSHFGRWPRGELHEQDGLLWFETPLRSLPYNGVVRSHLGEGAEADDAIAGVIGRMRSRGAECFWFGHPTATPADLGERLARHGVVPAEQITCMSLELAAWEAAPLPDGVEYREVVDDEAVRDYTGLTIRYWEIPEDERSTLAELVRHWAPGRVPGRRFLAYVDGEPIGKGYLSLAGPPGVAAIYGMSVRPEARGRGVASGLTTTLLTRAKELGCRRAVLHSTPGAVGVYRRAGFVERCPLTLYATTALWSDGH